MENYLPILRSLHAGGVKFAAIGTWALKAYFPEKMVDYVLQDCDIVLDPAWANVYRAINCLRNQNWHVTVWGNNIGEEVNVVELEGKYYLRATKDNWVLDLTFECAIAWPRMRAEIVEREGLPLGSIAHIFDLKRQKPDHSAIADALEQRLRDS